MYQYEAAIMCYDKVIEIDPTSAHCYEKKGDCLLILCQYEASIDCFGKAIQMDPNNANHYYKKGNRKFY